jgi:8-hydroxy-5-deazaflavin:NADPH oxidoreductase
VKIGILGAGRIGSSYGRLWAERGHQVTFSFSRDSERIRQVAEAVGYGARSVGLARVAAEEADALLLSVPVAVVPLALQELGPLEGQLLIDCTNAVGAVPDFVDGHASVAEAVAALSPGVQVVKSFNTVFAPVVAAGAHRFGGERAMMLFCGGDADAKQSVVGLIKDAGFEPADLGGLDQAHLVEEFARTVITLAHRQGVGLFGLKMLRQAARNKERGIS